MAGSVRAVDSHHFAQKLAAIFIQHHDAILAEATYTR